MLDIVFIRNNPDTVKEAARKKHIEVDVDTLLELDEKRRRLQVKLDEVRHEKNQLAAANKSGPPSAQNIEKGKELKRNGEDLSGQLDKLNDDFLAIMHKIPNLPADDVPEGRDEEGNVAIKHWGERSDFNFEPKGHVELGESLDLIDQSTSADTSGSRFYYLKGAAAQLELAMAKWAMDKLIEKDFTPVVPPQLVREHMMTATGFFPADANEIYHVNPDEDDLYLIGTSEVPLAGLHMNEAISADKLPRRYVGWSTCYRREAGSYGKDTRGIIRVHQFNKVEMYVFSHPDKSWQEHEYLLSIEEEVLQDLGLPYRVVNICGGDLGAPAAKKYDCEVWLPSQKRYLELTSCSNTTDFQSRRGSIKYEAEQGREYAHTLNGTVMASTRTLVAIMENYQTESGTIRVPEVLQGYINKEEIL